MGWLRDFLFGPKDEPFVGTQPRKKANTGRPAEKEYNSQFSSAPSQPKVTVTRRGYCEDSTLPPKGRQRGNAKRQQTTQDDGYWERWKKTYQQAETSSFNGRWSDSSPSFKRQRSPKWARVLGVSPDASKRQIKGAYRRLAREHHPDAGGNADDFRRIQEAYDEGMNR